MLFPSESPPHCRTKIQKQSDKLYNPATWKNLIESDRVLKRAQKSRNHLIFNIRNLFTRVYWSIFLARSPSSWGERGPHFFMQQRYSFLISLPNKTEISHNNKVLLSWFCTTHLTFILAPSFLGRKQSHKSTIAADENPTCFASLISLSRQVRKDLRKGKKKKSNVFRKKSNVFPKTSEIFLKTMDFFSPLSEIYATPLYFLRK